MAEATLPSSYVHDNLILRIAREIALDLFDIETILKNHQITPEQWAKLQNDPNFQRLLESETAAWSAAGNTHERTKLKAAMLVEEWLPEANARLHEKGETLTAKTELAKLLTRIAGMGLNTAELNNNVGEKFSITINLGADQQLKFEKQATPKVIEGEVLHPQEP